MAKLSEHTQQRVKALEAREDINPYERYYFGYQYGLGTEFLAPYFKKNGVNLNGALIAEIGCGEGGVLAAIADEGASEVLGIDIRQVAIDSAAKTFSTLGINADFAIVDITNDKVPDKWRDHFDLVLLRDVIEHLHETEKSLRNIMQFIKPGGYLSVVFPPYYSPFGAHQHLLDNKMGKLPFIQLLPDGMFNKAYKNARLQIDVEEVSSLREIRLTIDKFRTAAKSAGFETISEDLYFLRPVFKMKFGLPTIKANFLKAIPGLREIAALEASYLLRKPL